MNNLFLVGRLIDTPQLEYTQTNQKYTIITLAVTRPYKNDEGIYETDFIPVHIYNEMATSVTNYTKKGDLIGIKGRLETDTKTIVIVADKVTFLSTNTHKMEEGEI